MRDPTRTRAAGVVAAFIAGALLVGCGGEEPAVSLEMRIVQLTPADSLESVFMPVWGGEWTFYAHPEVLLTEDDVLSARVVRLKGDPAIELTFTDEARAKLLDVTQRNIGQRLGIIIDGHLMCAEEIEAPNETGTVLVTGHFVEPAAIRCSRALTRQGA